MMPHANTQHLMRCLTTNRSTRFVLCALTRTGSQVHNSKHTNRDGVNILELAEDLLISIIWFFTIVLALM